LPLDVAFRQTLLELRSEAERQRRLTSVSRSGTHSFKNAIVFEGKPQANGHGDL